MASLHLDPGAPSRRHHLALATMVGGGVALLAALVAQLGADENWAIDERVRATLKAKGHRRTRATLRIAGTAGTVGVYLPAVALTALILARRRGGADPLPLVASVAGAAGASWLLKHTVRRPRPRPVHGPVNERPSFPSGHATRASAAALMIAYVLVRERLAPSAVAMPLAVAIALATGASRAYADAHWTTDVIGGWALGGASAGLSAMLYENRRAERFT
jgi:membrane-associated phospholipid phosphatase